MLLAWTAQGAESAADREWKVAFEGAKAQKRLVFVDYYATWCAPCRVMDEKVFSRPDVKEQLANFVVVKVDVDRSSIGRTHGVVSMPSYIVYDPGERELIRITGARDYAVFRDAIRQLHSAQAGFLEASDLFAEGKELQGWFASGNAFLRLRMTDQARSSFGTARKVAEGERKMGAARLASIQEAFTFSLDGKTKKSIKLLQQIIHSPMTDDTAAIAWLMLGDVEELAKDPQAARDAYRHVQGFAAPGSPMYEQAARALSRLP